MKKALSFFFDDHNLGKIPGTNIEFIINHTFTLYYAIVVIMSLINWEPFIIFAFPLLYLIVTLHEFGHCFMAKRFGYQTQNITIFMFGGIASIKNLEKAEKIPKQELAIAFAGPAVNLILIVITYLLYSLFGTNSLFDFFLVANTWIMFYNLIPAFPLDGGRALRSLLGFFFPFKNASRMTGIIGCATHFILIVAGFFTELWIMSIISLIFFFSSWKLFKNHESISRRQKSST